jgi:CheY-like chemotaxis protein
MKQLEAENAALKAKAEEASAAARKLAFVEAGVDPSLPVAKYFMKGYDGELTADAIRQAAIEAQIIRDTKAAEVASEAKAWERTNQAAAGNTTGEAPVDFVTRINQAKSQGEVEMLLAEARQSQTSL